MISPRVIVPPRWGLGCVVDCFLGRCPRLACGCPFGAKSQLLLINTILLLTHLSRLFNHELQLLYSRLTLILRRQAIDQL